MNTINYIKEISSQLDQSAIRAELRHSKKILALYDSVVRNETSEEMLLANTSTSNKQALKQLKLRLLETLIDFVARSNTRLRNIDTYARMYRQYLYQLSAAKALLMSGARKAAIGIYERLIVNTIRCSFTDLTMISAKDLVQHYKSFEYHSKKCDKYTIILNNYLELYNREIEASLYFADLLIESIYSKGPLRERLLDKAIRYCGILEPYVKQRTLSYTLIRDVYLVTAIRYEIDNDHINLIKTCDKATKALNEFGIARKAGYFQFALYKIVALIQLQKYDRAEMIATKYVSEVINEVNWLTLKTYILLIKLRTGRYKKAYKIEREVINSDAYRRGLRSSQEIWKIYEAYIEYLVAIGKIKTSEPSTFRLHKFLNEIPLYSKDKRGLNIAILIIHFLFLLQQRKYSKIIDRAEALQLYCYRYLRKDDTFRSHCFIRMLLMMPKADFNRIRTERYAEPYLKKLKSVPLKVSQQTIEVEVIPYEDLWEMSLELLD